MASTVIVLEPVAPVVTATRNASSPSRSHPFPLLVWAVLLIPAEWVMSVVVPRARALVTVRYLASLAGAFVEMSHLSHPMIVTVAPPVIVPAASWRMAEIRVTPEPTRVQNAVEVVRLEMVVGVLVVVLASLLTFSHWHLAEAELTTVDDPASVLSLLAVARAMQDLR